MTRVYFSYHFSGTHGKRWKSSANSQTVQFLNFAIDSVSKSDREIEIAYYLYCENIENRISFISKKCLSIYSLFGVYIFFDINIARYRLIDRYVVKTHIPSQDERNLNLCHLVSANEKSVFYEVTSPVHFKRFFFKKKKLLITQ